LILLHIYSSLQFCQISHIVGCTTEKVKILIEEKYFDQIELQKYPPRRVEFITYNLEIPYSFFNVYFSERNKIPIGSLDVQNIDFLYVTDISYPLNNFILSMICKVNPDIKVILMYEGLFTINQPVMNFKRTIFDYTKKIITHIFGKTKYITRKKYLSGVDIPFTLNQLVPFNDQKHMNLVKSKYTRGLLNYNSFCERTSKTIVVVAQDIDLVTDLYIDFLIECLLYLKEKYKKYKIQVLFRECTNFIKIENLSVSLIKRENPTESAEIVISKLKPEIVVSHNSSVLFNLVYSRYPGRMIAYRPYTFSRMCKHTKKTSRNIQKDLLDLNITCYE